jgi:hypothetical protein
MRVTGGASEHRKVSYGNEEKLFLELLLVMVYLILRIKNNSKNKK